MSTTAVFELPAQVARAAELAMERKAAEVVVLDLRGISSATDFFLLGSGSSDTQVRSIAEHIIEELKKEPETVSVLQATRLPEIPGEKFWNSSTPQYLVFTTTLMLVRGRALQLSGYAIYRQPADIDWLKDITQRWQDEIRRLNK